MSNIAPNLLKQSKRLRKNFFLDQDVVKRLKVEAFMQGRSEADIVNEILGRELPPLPDRINLKE